MEEFPEIDSPTPVYSIYDRDGKFQGKTRKPISIYNLKVKRFGFCPMDTVDVTLELEKPIDSSLIISSNGGRKVFQRR